MGEDNFEAVYYLYGPQILTISLRQFGRLKNSLDPTNVPNIYSTSTEAKSRLGMPVLESCQNTGIMCQSCKHDADVKYLV